MLATPRLLALAEMATVKAVHAHLAPGETSVGTRVELEHLAPSPLGTHVEITAELTEVDGRRLVFGFEARDKDAPRRPGHDRAGASVDRGRRFIGAAATR